MNILYERPILRPILYHIADTAVTNLSTALAFIPDDSVVLSELGVTFIRQGKNQEAVSYLTKALENNSQDPESRYYLEIAKKQLDGERERFGRK